MWKQFEELKDEVFEIDIFDLAKYKDMPVMRALYYQDYCDPSGQTYSPTGYIWELVGENVEIPLDKKVKVKFFGLNVLIK